MKVECADFNGEFEWVCIGNRIIFDQKSYRGLADLIHSSRNEITGLASDFFNKPLNQELNVPKLKALLKDLDFKYEQIYISNPTGRYYNADGDTNYIMDRNYFGKVMSGDTVISEPIINRSTGRPIIAIATPILNGNHIVGLFGLTILIDSTFKGLHFMCTNKQKKNNSRDKDRHKQNRQNSQNCAVGM